MRRNNKPKDTSKVSIWLALFLYIALLVSLIFNYYFVLFNIEYSEHNIIRSEIVTEGNITYNITLENYYDVEYQNDGNGLILKIKNPCIRVLKGSGTSMKPYWDKNTLNIFDICFPEENLEIGDVIAYDGELDSTINVHHRIIDIDYNKRWVRTQGDNPETNSIPDDFVSFDRVIGKEIGVLNIIEDKKVVKKEVLNITSFLTNATEAVFISQEINLTCFCSSSGIMVVCHENLTMLINDTFVHRNNLKEEYC